MGALISAFATFIAKGSGLQFIAFKAILYTMLVVILPIILWNLGTEWTQTVLSWAMDSLPEGSFIYNATGLAGWLFIQFQLPEIFTVLINALVARLIIKTVIR